MIFQTFFGGELPFRQDKTRGTSRPHLFTLLETFSDLRSQNLEGIITPICQIIHYTYIPYHTIPYHTIPCHTIPYPTVPYRTMPYHTMPYHTLPYHSIPYHTIPYQYHTSPRIPWENWSSTPSFLTKHAVATSQEGSQGHSRGSYVASSFILWISLDCLKPFGLRCVAVPHLSTLLGVTAFPFEHVNIA